MDPNTNSIKQHESEEERKNKKLFHKYMDVIFETPGGRIFTMEIGFFDTVVEIKEKIQKYEGHPVSTQKLVFRGQELSDDRNTEYYEILQGSRMQLIVVDHDDVGQTALKAENAGRVQVIIIHISIFNRQLSLEVDLMDTVSRLKERIHELEGVPVDRFALFYGSIELQDRRTFADHGLVHHSEVSVVVKPFPPAPASSVSKKLKLFVLPQNYGTKKIVVEVNASDNVSELRKELQRLHAHLPGEDYFFIYKQNVMDDDRTFRWHDVRPGDTIEIFNGSVTGGL